MRRESADGVLFVLCERELRVKNADLCSAKRLLIKELFYLVFARFSVAGYGNDKWTQRGRERDVHGEGERVVRGCSVPIVFYVLVVSELKYSKMYGNSSVLLKILIYAQTVENR